MRKDIYTIKSYHIYDWAIRITRLLLQNLKPENSGGGSKTLTHFNKMENIGETNYYISGGEIIFINSINKEIKRVSVRKVIEKYREEIEKM